MCAFDRSFMRVQPRRFLFAYPGLIDICCSHSKYPIFLNSVVP
jgi:hypothetical protein